MDEVRGRTGLSNAGLALEASIRANPQLKDPNGLKAGQDIHLAKIQEMHAELAADQVVQDASPASPFVDPAEIAGTGVAGSRHVSGWSSSACRQRDVHGG